MKKQIEDRFWSKVEKGPVEQCWPWKASFLRGGYGYFFLEGTKQAHRMAYELTYGEIPSGKSVLHTCDNPSCCNPAHLFVGTQVDNMVDAEGKGRRRYARGEGSNAKLTQAQVKEIRRKYATKNYTYVRLATEYSVSFAAIWKIVQRKSWAWL
jgi:hypothetical protein